MLTNYKLGRIQIIDNLSEANARGTESPGAVLFVPVILDFAKRLGCGVFRRFPSAPHPNRLRRIRSQRRLPAATTSGNVSHLLEHMKTNYFIRGSICTALLITIGCKKEDSTTTTTTTQTKSA